MRNGPRTADMPMDTLYAGDPFPGNRQEFAYTNTAYDTSYEPRMYPNTTDEYYDPDRYEDVQEDSYYADRPRRPSRLPNSTWWKWSQDRRAALAKKEAMNANKLKNDVRVPTPIIKAREESIKFVAPELKEQHLPEEHKRQKPKKKVAKGKKGKKGKQKAPRMVDSEKDLSFEQWNELIQYWNHHAFNYLRFIALILAILSIGVAVFIIVSDYWVTYQTPSKHAGLWRSCFVQNETCNIKLDVSLDDGPWHLAVFTLMISTVAIGLCGICILTYGLCITFLQLKIYYCHSAAEIFIVSAFLELCALVAYPIVISKAKAQWGYSFNYCYFSGWAGFVFFCIAALALLFDELLRELSKPRDMVHPWMFWKKKNRKKKKKMENATIAA